MSNRELVKLYESESADLSSNIRIFDKLVTNIRRQTPVVKHKPESLDIRQTQIQVSEVEYSICRLLGLRVRHGVLMESNYTCNLWHSSCTTIKTIVSPHPELLQPKSHNSYSVGKIEVSARFDPEFRAREVATAQFSRSQLAADRLHSILFVKGHQTKELGLWTIGKYWGNG